MQPGHSVFYREKRNHFKSSTWFEEEKKDTHFIPNRAKILLRRGQNFSFFFFCFWCYYVWNPGPLHWPTPQSALLPFHFRQGIPKPLTCLGWAECVGITGRHSTHSLGSSRWVQHPLKGPGPPGPPLGNQECRLWLGQRPHQQANVFQLRKPGKSSIFLLLWSSNKNNKLH